LGVIDAIKAQFHEERDCDTPGIRGEGTRLTMLIMSRWEGVMKCQGMFVIHSPARLACIFSLLGMAVVTNASAQTKQSFELMEATIPQLHAALATGTISSRDLVTAYLARIDAYDQRGPALNAISVVNSRALDEAAAVDAERRAGAVRGLLHGIPIIVKDNYETAGMQTAAGSISLAGWVPPADATLVRKLRAAGAIIIAKANMHEFAYGFANVGSLFGTTRNPYALDRSPGGSSGGTGAAIAANFAAVGMGSDTCGSIRVPAFNNNLVGIRGTQGLASRTGIIPLSTTQDIGGPIGRTVTDIAIVLDAIAGYDPADPQTATSVGNIPRSYTDSLQLAGLRGSRIGLLTDVLGSDPADAEVTTILRAAVNEMKTQGAEILDIAIPGLAPLLTDRVGGFLMLVYEFRTAFDSYLAAYPNAPVHSLAEVMAGNKYHPSVRERLLASQAIESRDTKEYFEHIVKRVILRQAILKAMADNNLDALAYASVRRKASPIGEEQVDAVNCKVAANSGLPAIVVPAGFTPDGLPVGVELLGRAWSEPQLIKLAYSYEQATHHRRPPASTPELSR
jgi:Asp-tRNA(Asn)/Glu-tRNA(Gln) amidotransferase A subunit family amidase